MVDQNKGAHNAWALVLCVALLVSAVAAASSQAPVPSQARDADIYTIYSAMITSRMTQQTGPVDEIYLIDETTVTNSGGPGCVKAPAEDAAILAEVVADFNRRSDTSVVLTRQFTLPKPYELLDRKTTAGFLNDAGPFDPRGGAPPVNQNLLFPKAKRVFRFSEVYFDKSRTWALAWVAIYTDSVTFFGTWRPFKKSATGLWEENRSWTACGRGMVI